MTGDNLKPRYAIINDIDAPEPRNVVQLVDRRGYCYLDGTKRCYDGMTGTDATDVRAFGFSFAEDTDGMVRFYRNELVPTAKYRDGEPRAWQSLQHSFEWRILTPKNVGRKISKTKAGTA